MSSSPIGHSAQGDASTPNLRRAVIVFAVLAAIGTPIIQALAHWGLSAAEFASDGDTTLRAAGYAFSIWGLIYAGLIAYGVYQIWPTTPDTPLLRALAWPSVIAIAGCGVWIVASALNLKIASVVIIAVAAASLTLALVNGAKLARGWREQALVVSPLALLAGWLTIATAINVLTVLTAYGLIPDASAVFVAIAGVIVVTLTGAAVVRQARLIAYGAPIAWGLVGVYVAEQTHRPTTALAAAGAAVIVAATMIWVAMQQRRARP